MSAPLFPKELLQKVRRIEISMRKRIGDTMSGQFKSMFKGHGMQFSEHRIYVPGDDVRHIDWKVSARAREPLIKKYEEERELTVLLVVDVSASQEFGTASEKSKSEILAELGGMLAYAANLTGDKVGALLFSGKVEKIIPPKKGRSHVLRMIRDLLDFKPKTTGTELATALDAAGRVLKHAGVVFVLSDFKATGYSLALSRLARKHEVLALWLQDPREKTIPPLGWVEFEDPESGQIELVNTSSSKFQKWFVEESHHEELMVSSLLRSRGIDFLKVGTEEDYGEALVRFFQVRKRRKR